MTVLFLLSFLFCTLHISFFLSYNVETCLIAILCVLGNWLDSSPTWTGSWSSSLLCHASPWCLRHPPCASWTLVNCKLAAYMQFLWRFISTKGSADDHVKGKLSWLVFSVCLKLFLEGKDTRRRAQSMFPLSCAFVRVHRGRETSAHKKTCSAHKCYFQICFCTYFIHVVPNADESW